ncbi:DUF445 domain-containing protein [Salinimonas chungwhensis]|uniref:DUF445 domain-containing protein n=1 Tax=Salinimonas chungwhensis TaxID=265425 RepID=UPI00037F14F9|nr:DUF445 domain-containing protein [Salinimonas chungwhensis]
MKEKQLARAKRIALLWLLGAAVLFIIATVGEKIPALMPWSTLIGFIKMVSEAALIGGLADWFAVTALFKPIPPRYPIPHTNIVAANKHTIAQNLSEFVQEKFFHPEAIATLVRQSQPAQAVSKWLLYPGNAEKTARFAGDTVRGALTLVNDQKISDLFTTNLKKMLSRIDLSPLAGGTLEVLTREGRHQQLLDQLIAKAAALLQRPAAQQFITEKLHQWLKTEHRRLERFLPTAWLSEQGARVATQAIVSTIEDINADPDHPLRKRFDQYVAQLINDVENDPALADKLNSIRDRLLDNAVLHNYMSQILDDLRQRLDADLQATDSRLQSHMVTMLHDMAHTLATREEASHTVNNYITQAAAYVAPQVSEFLTRHIRTTIENWDEQEMAAQIELNIGKDLQKVRINGTLVGGLIGGILFLIELGIGQVLVA